MQQISAAQLAEWLKDPERVRPLLLDVREPWEFATCCIEDSMSMPMNSIPARYMDMDRETPTVVICHHGHRSMQVAMFLERQGFTNVINLVGGVAAWAHQVDPAMPTY